MTDSPVTQSLSRRTLLRYGFGTLGASVVGASVLSACGSSTSSSNTATSTSAPPTTTGSMGGTKLLDAAQAEGKLTTAAIGEPYSYYEPVVAAFEDFAGFKVNVQNPTYPATAEVRELAEAADKNARPPYDVVELTQSTAEQAADQKLLEPYLSSLWVDIPSVFKDADGKWSASYFGLVSFITNMSATAGYLPSSWDELATSKKTPKGSFAMLGDPRTGQPFEGGLGLLTVMSTAFANGGSANDVEPGLALLGELVDKEIFDLAEPSSLLALPDDAGTAKTPINVLYSFDLPLAQHNGKASQTKVEANAPSDGLVVGFYPQAAAARAQNPSAAQLWLEFLQSDRGAAVFLANGAIPTRHSAIRESGPKALRDALPPESELNAPVPSASQITAAQKMIDEKWTQYIPVKE